MPTISSNKVICEHCKNSELILSRFYGSGNQIKFQHFLTQGITSTYWLGGEIFLFSFESKVNLLNWECCWIQNIDHWQFRIGLHKAVRAGFISKCLALRIKAVFIRNCSNRFSLLTIKSQFLVTVEEISRKQDHYRMGKRK